MSASTPRPPHTLTLNPDGMPPELRALDQWVCWRWEHRPDPTGGKWTKVPIDPRTGRRADSTDRATWSPFAVACRYLEQHRSDVAGVGFVFSADDPYCGFDVDKAGNAETGEISAEASTLIDRFPTFAEWSISGTGVHLIGRGSLPAGGNRTGRIEAYDRGRFFVMSGNPIANPDLIADVGTELAAWHAELFPAKKPQNSTAFQDETAPLAADDELVLRRARLSHRFRDMEAGDDRHHGGDASAADQAFCDALVAAGADSPDQVDRIFRSSRRMREKWDARHYAGGETYGQHTAAKAFDGYVQNRYAGNVTPFRPRQTTATPASDSPACLPDVCQDWRDRALAAEAQLADVRGQLQLLELENAELRLENSTIINVSTNPHLKAEAPTLIRTAVEVREAKRRGDVDENGYVRIDTRKVGDDYGSKEHPRVDGFDTSIRSRSTVGRHLKKAADLGLIERDIRPAMVPKVVCDPVTNKPKRNPETNKIETVDQATKQTWVKLTGDSITDMLGRFAFFRAPETMAGEPPKVKTHGGDRRSEAARAEQAARRTRCPDCGSTDRKIYCAECGSDVTETAEADETHLIAEAKRLAKLVDGQAAAAAESAAFQDDPYNKRGLSTAFHLETGGRPPISPQEYQQGLAVYAGQRPSPVDRSIDVAIGATP